ncbi:hypothetical protein LTR78_009898 [Recurvomyces mirabilis]|uniref:BZIP domain-containing protein n=1 Tax=Recurvomyces mirabilis TaxID=574656 RepID=A0AAE0TN31_9PEZI|nr:hypothetical protein LTR78_009898 [Recurvomyces mirabilis]KAK5150573.1 hypothetical protein LTS14_010067 [Recurvomyces mirabilis]
MESGLVSSSTSSGLDLEDGFHDAGTRCATTIDLMNDTGSLPTGDGYDHGSVLFPSIGTTDLLSQGYPRPQDSDMCLEKMSVKVSSSLRSSSSTSPTVHSGARVTPASSSVPSRKRTSSPDSVGEAGSQNVKRQRNTEAARRYRQKKVDRVSELEEALAEMTRERDELRLRLAKSDGEVSVLRGMVGKG